MGMFVARRSLGHWPLGPEHWALQAEPSSNRKNLGMHIHTRRRGETV